MKRNAEQKILWYRPMERRRRAEASSSMGDGLQALAPMMQRSMSLVGR
jgi:hypothetical protein